MKTNEIKTFNCNIDNDDYYSIKVIGLVDGEDETIVTLDIDIAEDTHGNKYELIGGEFDEETEQYTKITLKKI